MTNPTNHPEHKLGRCDFRQYEHGGPHERIPDVGQRLPPFGCKNWKPEQPAPVHQEAVPTGEARHEYEPWSVAPESEGCCVYPVGRNICGQPKSAPVHQPAAVGQPTGITLIAHEQAKAEGGDVECFPFNAALALLYELSIANAPYSPGDCRDIADKVAARIGAGISRVKTILAELGKIDTVKLASHGLYVEANAVGTARVYIDRLIGTENQ